MVRHIAILLVLALAFAAGAEAANNPDPRLDAAASSLSGHPVTVYCEMDSAVWPDPKPGGYTWPPHDNPFIDPSKWFVIFIGPQACVGLHKVLDRNGTLFDYANSIHVLVHESFHQRDGIYANALPGDAYVNSFEGRADCAALAAEEAAEIGLFGFPATVQRTRMEFRDRPAYKWVYRYVWKRIHGKRVKKRIRVRVRDGTESVAVPVTETIRNPDLDEMHRYQQGYHNYSAAQNPAYAGDCTTPSSFLRVGKQRQP